MSSTFYMNLGRIRNGIPTNNSQSQPPVMQTPSNASDVNTHGAGTTTSSSAPTTAIIIDSTLCRHYALRGTCRFRDQCRYSHILPDNCMDWNDACQRIPCPHYIKGLCRYGTMCRLAHTDNYHHMNVSNDTILPSNNNIMTFIPGNSRDVVGTAALAAARQHFEGLHCSDGEGIQKEDTKKEAVDVKGTIQGEGETTGASESHEDEEDFICGICLEALGQSQRKVKTVDGDTSLVQKPNQYQHHRKKFGLMTGCDHIFCIQCLRTWRHEQKKEALTSSTSPNFNSMSNSASCGSDRVRACPACRQVSDFVVPSDRYCIGEEKKQVVAAYQARLSCIACRRFNGKLGSCPFGTNCFYAHWHPRTGQDMKPYDKTKQDLWQEKEEKRRLKQQRLRQQQYLQRQRRERFDDFSEDDLDLISSYLYLQSMHMFPSDDDDDDDVSESGIFDSDDDDDDNESEDEDYNHDETNVARAGQFFRSRRSSTNNDPIRNLSGPITDEEFTFYLQMQEMVDSFRRMRHR